MKIDSQKKASVAPLTEMVTKIHKMDYATVIQGKFVKLANDTKATDLDGKAVVLDSDNAKLSTPVGERTVDKDTYDVFTKVFNALTTLSNDVLHVVDKVSQEAYSAVIDLHDGTDFLVSKLEYEYKTLVGKLCEFINKSGVEILPICKGVSETYKPMQSYFDRLAARIHFRVDDLLNRRAMGSTIPNALEEFTKSLDYDDLKKVSVVLPNAEPSDSKKGPTKAPASKNAGKKS